jgi:ABC-type taurine transport system substrate-binding protein
MATGFPSVTGDVLTSNMFNGLVAFTLNAQTGTSYTAVAADQYQVLVTMNNASANTFSIPTDATYAFPTGTAITILQIGAGVTTINAVTSGTTTITSAGATSAAPVLARYKAAVAVKTGTNAWTIIGAVA